jgi:hypothetical protein
MLPKIELHVNSHLGPPFILLENSEFALFTGNQLSPAGQQAE